MSKKSIQICLLFAIEMAVLSVSFAEKGLGPLGVNYNLLYNNFIVNSYSKNEWPTSNCDPFLPIDFCLEYNASIHASIHESLSLLFGYMYFNTLKISSFLYGVQKF